MAWTASALSANLISATAADCPLFVAANVLRSPASVKWTDGDSFDAGTVDDTTDPEYPALNAVCAFPYRGTRARWLDATTYYFLIEVTTAVAFDTIAIRLNWTAVGTTSVTVKRATDATGTAEATICSHSAVSAPSRLIFLQLEGGTNSISGTGFIQIALTSASTEVPPELGGVYFGARRVLNRHFDMPVDDDPLDIDVEDFVARAGNRQRVVRDGPAALFRGPYTAKSSGAFSQDEVELLRGIYSDSRYGADPIIFVESPATASASAPDRFWYGRIPTKLRMSYENFGAYIHNFEFDEIRPYREPEAVD